MKNETKLVLNSKNSNEWQLKGELTMMSLSEEWKVLEASRPAKSAWTIDFSEINQMDSAGVAFLLDCIRYAKALKLELHFFHLPKLVFELIEAQGVMSLIDPCLKK